MAAILAWASGRSGPPFLELRGRHPGGHKEGEPAAAPAMQGARRRARRP